MRRAGIAMLLVASFAFGVTDGGASGSASLPYPLDLRVAGGGAWQASPRFMLEWTPPAPGSPPIAAVGYRLRNPSGAALREARRSGDRPQLEIQVPSLPGAYTAEIWMEGADGHRGPAASAVLRYDHARPGSPAVLAPSDWIAGSDPVEIKIQPPRGPLPTSGIGGYAVSVDRGEESWPCAARDLCAAGEIDLLGGAEAGVLSLGLLPEGSSVVRVVAVSGAGAPSQEPGSALVRVDATPPEVTLGGVPAGWAAGPVRVVAISADPISGMERDGPNGPFTAIAVDGGPARTGAGDSVALTVTGGGLHRVEAYARDAAGNVGSDKPHTAIVAIDETPPSVYFANRQDPAEPERIEATVADALSGADPGRGAIAVRAAGTSQPWRALRTVASEDGLVARWDSNSHPEGTYEFRATGYDRAGNVASSGRRANHTRMVLVNPLKGRVRLRAGLAAADGAGGVAYGQEVVYRGRLTSLAGAPLARLPVQVVESFGAGAAAERRSSEAATAADGTFSIRLSRGPSRAVEARFAGTRTLGPAASDPAHLHVRGAVRMRASARTARIGGPPVTFIGRVGRRGARLPAGGLPVELQFQIPGGDWAEFRTVKTDPRGRFRFAYGFSDDDSRGVRFRFRAYISGGDWPYEPAASKAVSVTGR